MHKERCCFKLLTQLTTCHRTGVVGAPSELLPSLSSARMMVDLPHNTQKPLGAACVPWRGLCLVPCAIRGTCTSGLQFVPRRSMESKPGSKCVVLVVGAQFAGLRARMLLQQQHSSSRRAAGAGTSERGQADFEVVLVDEKDYFEFTPSVLRCMLQPEASAAAACLAPHDPSIQVHRLTAIHSTADGEIIKINSPCKMLDKEYG